MMCNLPVESVHRARCGSRITRARTERGQSAVEFAIFLVMLVFLLMIVVQVTVVGVQKWQFNHFANYQARVWSVDKKSRNQQQINLMVYLVAPIRWGKMHPIPAPTPRFWPTALAAAFYTVNNDGTPGAHYAGVGDPLPIFKPFFERVPLIPLGPHIPMAGKIPFQTFIPIEHEPAENPNRWDNDCSDPCNDNQR